MKLHNKNRYFQIYFQIIDTAVKRDRLPMVERHHIIPRCMGGTDDPDNIVALTLREHFICHKLLIRITEGDHKRKLEHAFSYMVLTQPTARPSLRVTSHDYQRAREFTYKSRPKSWGENISKALAGKPQNPETVAKMKATLTGRKLTESHKENISKVNKGRKHSTDSIKLMKESKSRNFEIVFPDGRKELVVGLKTWAIRNGLNYHTLHNNTQYTNPINRGPLRGYKVNILPS